MSFPTATTPGIYRMVSPGLATGVKFDAASSDNVTFVTNIPSLDYAIRIWRTRWIMGITAIPAPSINLNSSMAVQLFAQLTENNTKTGVSLTDTSWLDTAYQQFLGTIAQSTAASITGYTWPQTLEVIHDFNPVTTPWTVATKLNVVVSSVVNTAGPASWTAKPQVIIEYTLETLTAGLRDYLSKRLQIQGS